MLTQLLKNLCDKNFLFFPSHLFFLLQEFHIARIFIARIKNENFF